MQTVTIQNLLDKQLDDTLGHLLYVVRDASLIFYVGQSKRDVAARFAEHLQKPSRLGQLIKQNQPGSLAWSVDFYTLADCRPFVVQKSLFALQAWESFDMDMAEQALIAHMRPVVNRDFNPHPTPLPARYRGHDLVSESQAGTSLGSEPHNRLWLNRMSLAGWVYTHDHHGRMTWHHPDGRTLSDPQIAPFRETNQIP